MTGYFRTKKSKNKMPFNYVKSIMTSKINFHDLIKQYNQVLQTLKVCYNYYPAQEKTGWKTFDFHNSFVEISQHFLYKSDQQLCRFIKK